MAKKRLQKKRSSSTIRKQESEILQVTTSKTEPVRVETSKVEPVKVETSKVEPVKVETSKVEPVKVETSKVEPVKVETSKVEPVKVETSKVEPVKLDVPVDLTLYNERFQKHYDELKWLYCELYQDRDDVMTYLHDLTSNMEAFYNSRNSVLKASDKKREADPDWYKRNDLVGMMMYVNNFAHTLKGLEEHLDYVEECNVNYLHLMPLLASPKGKSDGGYAVADFRTVQPELGTMEDFSELTSKCHERGINICLDFVMNHTSEEHEWAKRARAGEKEYQDRYFFFDTYDVPALYEKTCPQVFPTTAPGNFTWLDDLHKHVMTTFYPYQWDLNYANPVVFNEMVNNMLYLVNQGIDIVRIDAVPYIWKQLGTTCRNLPQVHTIVRMMRMITEIVCPGVLLLGEVVMEPEKVVPYFGTLEKPECHMLYNVTTMASTWHTVATADTRLLKHQMDIVTRLPKDYVFLNYLRCHDDIGWGLDYEWLKQFGIAEAPHKKYLNDYFRGYVEGSDARGELYNDDPVLQDARLCGTTASLCGLEAAGFEQNEAKTEQAIQRIEMLNAYLFIQSGIPVIYSGDEIGQVNDYSYKESEDSDRAADSRYLHRGHFRWDLEPQKEKKGTVQNQIFASMKKMEELKFKYRPFEGEADVWTEETYDTALLCVCRKSGNEMVTGLFNFSNEDRTAWIDMGEFTWKDLFTGEKRVLRGVPVPARGYAWYYRKWD